MMCRRASFLAISLTTPVFLAAAEFEATGLIEPFWEATLAPTVLGRVESIDVEVGDRVKAGDVLVSLERGMEELDAERRRIVSESSVELDLARAKLEVLSSEFEGTKRLFETSGSVSKEELERTRLEYQLAEAEISQLEEREKVEELEWKLALEQVSRRIIKTPQDGTIVEIFPMAGEVCEPRQPLVRIVDARTVKVALDVDALETVGIVASKSVAIAIDAPGGEMKVEGVIDFVSPVVDGASGLRRIQISIPNEEGRILPGLPARVGFSNSL